MIRFKITEGDDVVLTQWVEEPLIHGGVLTAVQEMTKLRQQYPTAKISIERTTVIPQPERKMFRFDVAVQQGTLTVKDGDGEHTRDVSGLTLQSDVFQEAESERVLAHLQETFPKAKFTKREVRHG